MFLPPRPWFPFYTWTSRIASIVCFPWLKGLRLGGWRYKGVRSWCFKNRTMQAIWTTDNGSVNTESKKFVSLCCMARLFVTIHEVAAMWKGQGSRVNSSAAWVQRQSLFTSMQLQASWRAQGRQLKATKHVTGWHGRLINQGKSRRLELAKMASNELRCGGGCLWDYDVICWLANNGCIYTWQHTWAMRKIWGSKKRSMDTSNLVVMMMR